MFGHVWRSIAELMGAKVSENAITLAFDLLKNYSIEEIRIASKDHMADVRTGKYMPKPAHLIERIYEKRKRSQFYQPKIMREDNAVKSIIARNECVYAVKRLLPKFTPFEDKKENAGKTQAELWEERKSWTGTFNEEG